MIPGLVTMACPVAYTQGGLGPLPPRPPTRSPSMLSRITTLGLVALFASAALAEDSDPNSRIIAALELPHAANDARRAGVGDDQIKIVLELGKDKKADSGDIAKALRAGAEGSKANGPVDNFGAFVQAQLAAGLHGTELAAAIRAEHEAHGKGHHGPDGEHPGGGHPPEGMGKGGEGMGGEGKGGEGKGGEGHGAGMGKAPAGLGKGPPPEGGKPPPGKGGGQGAGKGGAGGAGGGAKAPPKGDDKAAEANKGGGRK